MEVEPGNVTGKKIHRFEHRIDWGHVALAAAALLVVFKFSGGLTETPKEDDTQSGVKR